MSPHWIAQDAPGIAPTMKWAYKPTAYQREPRRTVAAGSRAAPSSDDGLISGALLPNHCESNQRQDRQRKCRRFRHTGCRPARAAADGLAEVLFPDPYTEFSTMPLQNHTIYATGSVDLRLRNSSSWLRRHRAAPRLPFVRHSYGPPPAGSKSVTFRHVKTVPAAAGTAGLLLHELC